MKFSARWPGCARSGCAPTTRVLTATLVFAVMLGCSRTAAGSGEIMRPGAPGQPGGGAEVPAERQPTEADLQFMQGMMRHHAQALEMTSLVEERTDSEDVRLLARRIELSQIDEMAMIQRWLEAHGGGAAGGDHQHAAGGGLMPGMLTEAEMAELGSATGEEFDRLFLQYMIRHHQGALVMVQELFATPGAAEDTDVYQFASHADSDQRIEIARMSRMLAAMQ